MGEKGEGEEKEQGGSREKQLWCVGRVNVWPPADVCLMGTRGLAELGYLHGKFCSKLQACTGALPLEGAYFAPLFSSRAQIFIKRGIDVSDTLTVLTDAFQAGQQVKTTRRHTGKVLHTFFLQRYLVVVNLWLLVVLGVSRPLLNSL